MKKTRMLAALCSLLLAAILLISYDYIIEKAHHQCQGEDCPICHQIEASLKTISSIKTLPLFVIAGAACFMTISCCILSKESADPKSTLVSLKVELLN